MQKQNHSPEEFNAARAGFITLLTELISRNIPDEVTSGLIRFFNKDTIDVEFEKKAMFDAQRVLFLGYIRQNKIKEIEDLISVFMNTEIKDIDKLEFDSLARAIIDRKDIIDNNPDYRDELSSIIHKYFQKVATSEDAIVVQNYNTISTLLNNNIAEEYDLLGVEKIDMNNDLDSIQ